MTFLELVNQLREEIGATGAALTTLGGALPRDTLRYKNWINRAWRAIQSRHRTWRFMEVAFSFDATPGTQTYTASVAPVSIANFANWKLDSLRCWLTATGSSNEQVLPFMDWDTFRNLYLYGSNRTLQQRPVVFTVDPNKKLVLGPIPDVAYTISGYYRKSPQALSVDADEPFIDAEFHELIVFYAMKKFGYFDAAAEALARANEEGDRMMTQLETDYLPKVTMSEPLA